MIGNEEGGDGEDDDGPQGKKRELLRRKEAEKSTWNEGLCGQSLGSKVWGG